MPTQYGRPLLVTGECYRAMVRAIGNFNLRRRGALAALHNVGGGGLLLWPVEHLNGVRVTA